MPRCAACGQDNPEGFQFCWGVRRRPHPYPAGVGQERRLVSVLFCDLVGFTARADHADPEDVANLLRPTTPNCATRSSASAAPWTSSSATAPWPSSAPPHLRGRPRTRRPLRAGILAAIDQLNQAHQGLELAVRVGVTSGEALVTLAPGGESEAVMGGVVNTASRLQGLAPVNAVVVGEGTFRATSRSFGFARLGRVRVKGKAEPLAIWRLLGPHSRTGIDTVRRPDTLRRQTLRRRGITPRIARRGIESSARLGRHRYVVERSLAWLVGYRRLQVRYERRADLLLGFCYLACALICLKSLHQSKA